MMKKIFGLFMPVIIWLGTAGPASGETLTLMLDWFPNIDHLPIYTAQAEGYFGQKNLEIKIISPSETADALKLAAAGHIDIAISYQPQTIIAASQKLPVVVFGRLVEHPLTTLLFLKNKGIKTPRDLEGKRIGYTVPGLMDVLLKAFAQINGIKSYRAVNVGFAIAQSLIAGKVDAVMGPFKTYETVQMQMRGYQTDYFELEKWGIPDYDELIFVCAKRYANRHSKVLTAFADVVAKGIVHARAFPKAALENYFKAVSEADRPMETAAFELTRPYYAHQQKIDQNRWQTFADFAWKHALIEKPVDVTGIIWKLGK